VPLAAKHRQRSTHETCETNQLGLEHLAPLLIGDVCHIRLQDVCARGKHHRADTAEAGYGLFDDFADSRLTVKIERRAFGFAVADSSSQSAIAGSRRER